MKEKQQEKEMPVCTYYSKDELMDKQIEAMEDPELGEWIGEVRAISTKVWVIKNTVNIFKGILWWTCLQDKSHYNVLMELGGGEYQIINFPNEGEGESSINLGCTKQQLLFYLMGYVNGAEG